MMKRRLTGLLAFLLVFAVLLPASAFAAGTTMEPVVFNGHVYQIIDEGNITWNEAKARCERLSGHLVTITSQEEQDFVVQYLAAYGRPVDVWIGIQKRCDGADWSKWVTGEAVTYTHWAANQPDNGAGAGQDYGVICNTDHSGKDYKGNPYVIHSGEWDDIDIGNETQSGVYLCEWDSPFQDVPKEAYYYDPVLWAVDNEITTGTAVAKFSPDDACTRAQVVTFLYRLTGSPASSGKNPFTDVPANAYYADAVRWAASNGVTKGTSATTFSPNEPCTREQIVSFLHRYFGSQTASVGNPFVDVQASAYSYSAILWAVENGITKGTTPNTFSPTRTCTRAEVVTFVYRAKL